MSSCESATIVTLTNEPTALTQSTAPAKAQGRKKSWSRVEDRALCNAWLATSIDAIRGTDQDSQAYWTAIFNAFVVLVESNVENREQKSLEHRWGKISKMVSLFCGCVAQVKNAHHTGANENDEMRMANDLYEKDQDSPFVLMHCYELLKTAPKWSNQSQTRSTKAIKAARVESVAVPVTVSVEDETRPVGSKAAKSRARKAEDESLEFLELSRRADERATKRLALMEEMRNDELKRTALLETMRNDEIMKLDLAGLDEVAREYFMKEKRKILANMNEIDTE